MKKPAGQQQGALRDSPISAVFTAPERGTVRRAAFLSDQTVSTFIRNAAVKAAAKVLGREQAKAA